MFVSGALFQGGLYQEGSYCCISAVRCVCECIWCVCVCVCVLFVCLDEYGKMPCSWILQDTPPSFVHSRVVKKKVGRLFSLFPSHWAVLRYCQLACSLLPNCCGCVGLNIVPCVFPWPSPLSCRLVLPTLPFSPLHCLVPSNKTFSPPDRILWWLLLLSHLMTSLVASVALTWWF